MKPAAATAGVAATVATSSLAERAGDAAGRLVPDARRARGAADANAADIA